MQEGVASAQPVSNLGDLKGLSRPATPLREVNRAVAKSADMKACRESAKLLEQMNKVCPLLQPRSSLLSHTSSQLRHLVQMEQWAKSSEERSIKLSRANQQLRATLERTGKVSKSQLCHFSVTDNIP